MYTNICDAAKVVLRRKFIVPMLKKKINNLTLYLIGPGKEE